MRPTDRRYWLEYECVGLTGAVVYRRGSSRSLWSYEREDAACDAIVGWDGDEEEALGIRFSIAAQGGGRTSILVRLAPEDLVSLLRAAVLEWESADTVVLEAVQELLRNRLDEST